MSDFRHLLAHLALLLCFSAVAAAVRAEVWGFVDADGTAHVATEKLDDRYQLFFKGRTTAQLNSRAAADPADLAALRETSIYKRMVAHPNILRYQALIDKNARMRGLDAALVKAVIACAIRRRQRPETHAGAETS